MANVGVPIRRCRLCGSDRLASIWDLGDLYLSDFPAHHDLSLPRSTLHLMLCDNCSLVQLEHSVDPDLMYRNYWYESQINERMREVLQMTMLASIEGSGIRNGDVVLDIGANDGTMLAMYQGQLKRIGVDPCGLPPVSKDIEIIRDYFPTPKLKGVKARIINTIACFYDQHDVSGFVEGIIDHLHDDGRWVVQMTMAEDMHENFDYGNICHEHLTYWTDASMQKLADMYGLYIISKNPVNINGASRRYILRKATGGEIRQRKVATPLGRVEWKQWADKCQKNIGEVRRKIERAWTGSGLVAGYGASTKGNTMLQLWGMDPASVAFIADRNPRKHGHLTVGTWIPIVSEELMRYIHPSMLVVLPWGFTEAFKKRERQYMERGGKLLVPCPVPEVQYAHRAEKATSAESG